MSSIYDTGIKNTIEYVKKHFKVSNGILVTIEGQNPKIGKYQALWQGNPKDRKYRVRLGSNNYRTEDMKLLNLAPYISSAWANNFANEGMELYVPDEKSNDILQNILDENGLKGKFNSFVDSYFGLGSGAIVVNSSNYAYDSNTDKIVGGEEAQVKLMFVDGTRVIPITVDDGEVTECAFVKFRTGGSTLIIHFLINKQYIIAEVDGSAVDGGYDWDFNKIRWINTESTIPLFTIWQPVKPNKSDSRLFNGESIYEGAEDSLFQCDLVYDAMYREIKLGKKIRFVTQDTRVIDYDAKGNPIEEDYQLDDETIIIIPSGKDGSQMMQEFNAELRVQPLTSVLTTHMNASAMMCGLGQETFQFDAMGGRPIQTATGEILKKDELYRNVTKQENFARHQFRKMIQAIIYVNNNFTKNEQMTQVTNSEISITFDDNIVEDTSSKKEQELKELSAGTLTIAEYRSHWYGETLEEAEQYVHTHGLLIDKYLVAFQSKAITEEMFITLVFGDDLDNKMRLSMN